MKKLGIMVGVIVLLLGVVFWAINSGKANVNEIYHFINGQTLEQKVEDKEDFVVYVYGEYCNYCKEFAPTIEGFLADNKFQINKIASDTNQADADSINKVLGDKMQGTPAVYVFSGGKVIDYIVGNQPKADFEAFANKNIKYFSLPPQSNDDALNKSKQ